MGCESGQAVIIGYPVAHWPTKDFRRGCHPEPNLAGSRGCSDYQWWYPTLTSLTRVVVSCPGSSSHKPRNTMCHTWASSEIRKHQPDIECGSLAQVGPGPKWQGGISRLRYRRGLKEDFLDPGSCPGAWAEHDTSCVQSLLQLLFVTKGSRSLSARLPLEGETENPENHFFVCTTIPGCFKVTTYL